MKFVKIKTQFEGFHQYKDAPEEVSFLRNRHRHLFIVTVKIGVDKSNRELEYFMVLKDVKVLIKKFLKETKETESCEMIAEFFLDYLETKYTNRKIEIEVSEDGENGSGVNNYKIYE